MKIRCRYLCSAMKTLSIFLLVVLLITATFSKWVLIASYNINQNYIATVLCINKAKPKSCCKGKCYLGKQMSKEESNESTNTSNGKEKLDIQLFYTVITNSSLPPIYTLTTTCNSYNPVFALQNVLKSCFRPPQA
jgi:hypothetical protein